MAADYKTLLGLVREFVERVDAQCFVCKDEEIIERSRAAILPSAPKPTNDPKITHMGVTDDCCRVPFAKEARAGEIETMDWVCPKCGTTWLAKSTGFLWQWEPLITMQVFRP